MKTIKTMMFCFTAFCLFSCDPVATFNEPQPVNETSLNAFPNDLQGQYIDSDHASIITISSHLITRFFDFDYKVHKDSIGANYKIIGDVLINLQDSSKQKIVVMGDTIIHHYQSLDTLFFISANNILKKYKGYYFLNCSQDSHTWEVKQLALQNGILSIGSISNNSDIQKLKQITHTTHDTVSYQFSLTKRQFKKFIKQNGFANQEKFTRLANNQEKLF